MPRILSISGHHRLRTSRDDALALAGYTVASPKEPNEAVLLLSEGDYDAVVVTDSVEQDARKVLIAAIRNVRPYLPILFVYADPETIGEPLADVSVDVTIGLLALVTALDTQLRRAQSA